MGDIYQYHITMLITGEQEDAIRLMFNKKNWPCWLNVLTDENVTEMVQNGYTDIFPVLAEGQDGGIGRSIFTEIKSEIVNVDTEEVNITEKTIDPSVRLEKPRISEAEDMDTDIQMAKNNDLTVSALDCPNKFDSQSTQVKSNNEKNRKRNKPNITASQGSVANKKKIKCSFCETYLATQSVLKRHCQRRHRDVWLEFDCKDCSSMFKTKEELWKHRNEVNHEPPKEKPKHFEKRNLTPEELVQMGHIKCNACDNCYPTRRQIRSHFYTVHRELMPNPMCSICDTEFKTREELWQHKRETQHNDCYSRLGNYQCDTCGKILKTYYSFKKHTKLSCGIDEKELEKMLKYPCDVCGLVYKSMLHVKAHKKSVHLMAPEVCDICGTVCKNKSALLKHKKRHDESNKKFSCDDCGKSFLFSSILKQHIRTHTKEKPYKCPMCNYTCAIKQNIHKHSINVHKVQATAVDLRNSKETVLSRSNNRRNCGQNVGVKSMLNETAHGPHEFQTQSEQNVDDIVSLKNNACNVSSSSNYEELKNNSANHLSYSSIGSFVQYQ